MGSRTNRLWILLAAVALGLQLPSTGLGAPTHVEGRSEYRAPRAAVVPRVDGVADDAAWESAPWRELSHRWLGPEYSPTDFQGRFKVVWTPERIYILAEIVDDILFDRHRDPLVQYWDDDCLEIFLDADFSGGDHQSNHNAFAYHLSLDNQAIDIGTDKTARSYRIMCRAGGNSRETRLSGNSPSTSTPAPTVTMRRTTSRCGCRQAR